MTQITLDNLPKTNSEVWTLYPQYSAAQQTSMVFDFQTISWTPFKTKVHTQEHPAFNVEGYPGFIYTKPMSDEHLTTYVAINKGNIKWMGHCAYGTVDIEEEIRGSLELRIGAFVTTVYKKFSGIISFESYGDSVVAINLTVNKEFLESVQDEELLKNIKRLYTRREWK